LGESVIEIVSYRPSWQTEFQELGSTLRGRLGDIALRIDHIGSTSIPGLCAKNIIDIQVTVAQLGGEANASLRSLGYLQHPDVLADHVPPNDHRPETDWAKFFFMQPTGQRRTNVHVRQAGKPNQRYALLFRDYLASHPPVAAAYGELKRRLAASLASDDAYPDVKDPAVDLIYFAAEEWASASQWHPPQSGA
jgi:GrpB-like predicted nucleotidyltransferase (UPF0157 family)